MSDKPGLPFQVTQHFESLAGPEPDDPIRRQFFPDPRENEHDPFALDDPLGESSHSAAPNLVHQYPDRALLLASDSCAGYCRHCFRRVWLGKRSLSPAKVDLEPALEYLAAHTEIRELLVSGGDPLLLHNADLRDMFFRLRKVRPDIKLRVCTRIPVTNPSRLNNETITLLAEFSPLRLAVQINHPREISAPSRTVFADCIDAGITVLVQTVLLRGINDDPQLLAGLFRQCSSLGLSPYYLFQMDLAPGTAHFRVPLKQGLAIYSKLKTMISGNVLPVYALDLPGGGGKIHLHENIITGEKITGAGKVFILKDNNGVEWEYPAGI